MPMSGREMVKYYEKHGWTFIRQRGSHYIMSHPHKGTQPIPIPLSGRRVLNFPVVLPAVIPWMSFI